MGGPDRPWRAVAGVLAGSLEGLKRRFSREILIQKANGGPKEEKTMKEVLAALEICDQLEARLPDLAELLDLAEAVGKDVSQRCPCAECRQLRRMGELAKRLKKEP